MLSQPIFGDRSLSQAFYRTVIERFSNAFKPSVRALLAECTFGFAPSPEGIKTFFVVAPALEVAEELLAEIDTILARTAELMVGVGQVALCAIPPGNEPQQTVDLQELEKVPSECLVCKFFSIIGDSEASDS
ncbi:MAG: hypothetical protein MUE44_19420 [Oscillatoriaceae cyanobacterium Prado104]|jgi:hypothetical protein|nr:hypothetical protein [Oscillatoriaceae cyanobacterium Prado104]